MMVFSKLFSNNNRTINVKTNVLASAIIKGADTLVYLLLVPLTLGYLNSYEYGIWLTLNSFLSWIDAFDVGLGSGLRNKLGETIASNNYEKGRAYVSTTFFMLIIITIVIFILGFILIKVIDWYKVLNIEIGTVSNLSEIIFVSFLFFCLNFIFKFVGNVYQAMQLPAINSFISFSGHLLSLIVIFILTKTVQSSLFLVALVYSAAPPIIYMLSYKITFSKLYPYFSPSLFLFKKSMLRDLLSLSVFFFIFQVMGIVLFSASNILISNFFGPEQVTPYNIAYRYFSLLLMMSNLLMAPIWSAATDAYSKNDLMWIQGCRRKLNRILIYAIIVIVLMIVISPYAYQFWVGSEVIISPYLSISMGLYVFILIWSLSFSSILNGMSKLKLQAINIIFVGVCFYPLCKIFALHSGVIGIVIGMIVLNIPGAVLNTIQLNKILNNNAIGIWNE